ncbi:hypothetical protein L9F63_014711, partial [Diploptera punctata]
MGPCPNDIVSSKSLSTTTTILSEIKKQQVISSAGKTDLTYSHKYVWRNIIFMLYAHLGAFYGLYLLLTEAKMVLLFEILYGYLSLIGVTGGTHRLWSHRSYKAKFPLRVLLMIFQTAAFQNHIYEWSRDHRVHHKFSETDGDPHNAKRGFFFCHMGWLMVKKHPDVLNKGKRIDMSDLEKDPVVVFQRKYYPVLMPLLAFILPTLIPIYVWNTDPWTAWYGTLFRWVITVNGTWCVNSFAHLWGSRPYNTPIFNLTARFIDFFAKFGWAYDLKVVSEETIKRRILRTGRRKHIRKRKTIWGWVTRTCDDSSPL